MFRASEFRLILLAQNRASNTLRTVGRDLRSLEAGGAKFGSRFSHVTQVMGDLGRSMTLFGGITLAGLGIAANSAAKFNTQIGLISTQTDNMAKTSRIAFKGILSQMTQFPATAQDMTASLYDVYSGTQLVGKGGLTALRTFNKAAVAGQTDLNTATQAGITILNNYGHSARDLPKLFNQMFAAVRFGRITFSQFGNSLNQIVPAFRTTHQSLNTMLGAFAFLTRQMPSSAQAATSLARAIETLDKPQMLEGLKKAGVTITNLHGQLLPLPEVIGRILQKFPGLASGTLNVETFLKNITNQQGYIQARRGLTQLFQHYGDYLKVNKQVLNDTNEFNRSYARLSQTAGVRWGVFMNQLHAAAILIGTAVLPVFLKLVKPIREAVVGFEHLSPALQATIGKFAAWGAIGTVAVGLFLSLSAGIATLIVLFDGLATAALAVGAVGASLLGFAGIALLVYKHWSQVKGFLVKYWPDIVSTAQSARNDLIHIVTDIQNIFAQFIGVIGDFIHGNWAQLWKDFGRIVSNATDLTSLAFRGLSTVIQRYIQMATSSIQGFITALGLLGAAMRTGTFQSLFISRTKNIADESGNIAKTTVPGLIPSVVSQGRARAKALDMFNPFSIYRNNKTAIEGQMVADREAALTSAKAQMVLWNAQVLEMARRQRMFLPGGPTQPFPTSPIFTPGGGFSAVSTTGRDAQVAREALDAATQMPIKMAGASRAMLAFKAVGTSATKAVGAGLKAILTTIGGFVGGGPLLGGIIALGAAIVYLKQKYDTAIVGVAHFTSAQQRLMDQSNQVAASLRQESDALGNLTNAANGAIDAHLQLARAKLTVKEDRVALNQAIKSGNKLQIEDARLTLQEAQNQLRLAQGMNVAASAAQKQIFAHARAALATTAPGQAQITRQQALVDQLAGQQALILDRARVPGLSSDEVFKLAQQYANVTAALGKARKALGSLTDAQTAALKKIEPALTKYVQAFAPKLNTAQTRRVVQYLESLGRIPKPKDLNKVIKIALQGAGSAINHARSTHSTIQQTFAKIIYQTIGVKPPALSSLSGIAHAIISGISGALSAIGAGPISSVLSSIVNTAISIAQKSPKGAHASSPSKKTARLIGVPLIQGIAMGMKQAAPMLDKEFQSSVLGAFLNNVGAKWNRAMQKAGIFLFQNRMFTGTLTAQARKLAASMGVIFGKDHTWGLAGNSVGRLIAAGIKQSFITAAGGGPAAWKSIQSSMLQSFQGFRDSFQQSFGTLFGGTTQNSILQTAMGFGGKVPFSLVSADLKAQLTQFRTWTSALNRLRRRGIPFGLYQQLLALGPDSLPAVQALASATGPQLHAYERMYRQEQSLIGRATRQAFAGQVAVWRSMGHAIAFGILTGLKSDGPGLEKWLAKIAHQLFSPPAHHGKVKGGASVVNNYTYNQHLHQGTQSNAAFMRKARWHFESRIPRT